MRNREIGWDDITNRYWYIARQFEELVCIACNISITTTTTTTAIPGCNGYSGSITVEALSEEFFSNGIGYIDGLPIPNVGSASPSPIIIPEGQVNVIICVFVEPQWVFGIITDGGPLLSVYEIIIDGTSYPITEGTCVVPNNIFIAGQTYDICINYNDLTSTTTTTTSTTSTSSTTTTTTTICYADTCNYGPIYNFYAVATEKIAPTNWRIPTDSEWMELATELGGQTVAGGKMKTTGYCDWSWPNVGATNESGFSGLPTGIRGSDGTYGGTTNVGYFWSSTPYSEIDCPSCAISYGLAYSDASLSRAVNNKKGGFSIRVIRDYYEGFPTTIQDYDGNTYDVIQIGTKLWTVQNLKTTHYNDGEIIPNVIDNTEWGLLTTGAMDSSNLKRPVGLPTMTFSYSVANLDPPFPNGDFTESYATACQYWQNWYYDSVYNHNHLADLNGRTCYYTSFTIGGTVYYGLTTDCDLLPDGFYVTNGGTGEITEISGGVIVNIYNTCTVPSTTTTTTTTTI